MLFAEGTLSLVKIDTSILRPKPVWVGMNFFKFKNGHKMEREWREFPSKKQGCSALFKKPKIK